VVGARTDGLQHLVGLGGGEDEDEEPGRLFDELEQGVEALRRDHVGLIDDVDLVAIAHRGVERPFAQVAGVINATVAGRIDLDHVDGARTVRSEFDARVAYPAGRGRRALDAVQRARKDACAGGLAAAARAGEEVGVVDAPGRQRLRKRGRDVVLTDDLSESGRPVAAVQS
jgi:hypothetical protein